eukprot:7148518-Pyramimonas_sp.AAC.1
MVGNSMRPIHWCLRVKHDDGWALQLQWMDPTPTDILGCLPNLKPVRIRATREWRHLGDKYTWKQEGTRGTRMRSDSFQPP